VKQDVRFPAAGRSRPEFFWLGGGFTRDEIERFEDQGLRLPRTDSISRWLIEEWLKEEPAWYLVVKPSVPACTSLS